MVKQKKNNNRNKNRLVKKSINIITKLLIPVFLLMLIISPVLGQDHVIANSADWRDVYSTILYANLQGIPNHFLTSMPHGPILLYEIPKTHQDIKIITSADKPFMRGYESLVRSKGYDNPEELIFDEANLELAKMLPDINKYIIIDDSYGYNAIAAAPYAAKAKYYVLFADERNIGEIDDFLSARNVEDLIIFGHTDREVQNTLAKYNPEIMNSETGSRFENNIMMVEKYKELSSIKQVILTNGEFIEASMMTGKEPVLFIGTDNVPEEIREYIKKSGIEIGVLIGNELIGTATIVRRQIGISVFVKFARGSRVPGGTINPVEDLDRFPMPSYSLSMSITSITYNQATGLLEVNYKNNVDLATYFKSTITVKQGEETLAVVGDEEAVFIDGGDTKTSTYEIDLSEAETLENLTGEIYTIYGESKTSLEKALRGTFKIETVTVMDDADIEILDLVYDKSGRFLVSIKNTGPVDVYVDAELVDLWINGEYVTVSSDEIENIGVGKTKKIPITITLEDEDLNHKRNQEIAVRGVYGERRHALVRVKTKTFALKIKKAGKWYYIPVAILLVLIILFLLLGKKRKKRCPRCRTLNEKDARHCKKCGHAFK